MHVLIDDDTLIHQLWKMAARDAGVELRCFSSVDDFLTNTESISRESNVYVDSNLKETKGEEEAFKIKEAGFEKIFIATGYNPESVQAPDFVLGVIGKRPPF